MDVTVEVTAVTDVYELTAVMDAIGHVTKVFVVGGVTTYIVG